MKKKRIIVSVINDLVTDQRVRKICEALVEMDYNVLLVGRKMPESLDMPETSYAVHRMPFVFKKGVFFYAWFNIRLFLFLIFKKADVLLANDLDTLYANTWAKKFKSNCKLIYDSHEFFTEVPELITRPKVQRFWEKIEKRCLPQTDAMYTVNESIAQLYRDKYGVAVKVVRNISDYSGNVDHLDRRALGLPVDKFIVIMQGAGINIDRGAEEMVEAITQLEDFVLLIVGNGDVIPSLKVKVAHLNLQERVIFVGKKPYYQMMQYTAVADLGASLDKNSNINYRFSLPNKIFDYIHAGIPLMVTDLVEVRKIVEENEVGVILADLEVSTLVSVLLRLKNSPEQLALFKTNTITARKKLNWQNEKLVLESIYK